MRGKILHSVVSCIRDGAGYWGQDANPKVTKWLKWRKMRGLRWKRAGGGTGKKAGRIIRSLADRFSMGSITDVIQIMAPVLLCMALALLGGSAIMRHAAKVPLKYDRAVWIAGSAFLVIAAFFALVRAGSIAGTSKVPVSLLSIWISVGSLGLMVSGFGVLFTLFPSFFRGVSIVTRLKHGFAIAGLSMVFIGFGIWLGMSAVESKNRPAISATVVYSSIR